jgi:hypothetical protein
MAVPLIPIAIDVSALRAGASFTPSPVIATNWSFACSAFIILIFVQG